MVRVLTITGLSGAVAVATLGVTAWLVIVYGPDTSFSF